MTYAVTVNQILDIRNEGKIQLSLQVYLSWIDNRLKWSNESQVGLWNWTNGFRLPSYKIWKPIIDVLTCEENDCSLHIPNNSFAHTYSTGIVSIVFKTQAVATCKVSLEFFPFDRQTCEFYLDIVNVDVDYNWTLRESRMKSYYMDEHNEWTFTNFKIGTQPFKYNVISRNTSYREGKWRRIMKPWDVEVVVLSITAVRETTYYMTNLIVPLLIVNLVAVASAAFPAGSSERPNTLLTVILAYCFFQSVVASVLPHTREDSLIGSYLMWAMVSATAQLLVSFYLLLSLQRQSTGISANYFAPTGIKVPELSLYFTAL